MPADKTRITYDENGGQVTEIPKLTPKGEIKKAREEGRVDKNDPAYDVETAKDDIARANDAKAEAVKDYADKVEDKAADENKELDRNDVERTEDVRVKSKNTRGAKTNAFDN